eukprot:SAG31_NODE_161_length_21899_cov_16.832844_4_plen_208_part_00
MSVVNLLYLIKNDTPGLKPQNDTQPIYLLDRTSSSSAIVSEATVAGAIRCSALPTALVASASCAITMSKYQRRSVACSFVSIAVVTIFARWVSSTFALKCPFGKKERSASFDVQNVQQSRRGLPQKLRSAPPNVSIKFGRPDMSSLIEVALHKVEATSMAALPAKAGLFVCVCGPKTLVQSCKDAVREAKRKHRGVMIGLHAEEPDW